MKEQAQLFMNQHGIKECYECDGLLFKQKDNADARAAASGKEVVTHTASAGARKKKKDEEDPQ